MAKQLEAFTWENGFKAPSTGAPWIWPPQGHAGQEDGEQDDPDAYVSVPSKDVVTSSSHNSLGINVIRTWPTMYDGTNSPHGNPQWWTPRKEVDVLICGAGPSGLQVALSLVRQNLTFRIIDKAEAPLAVGRADGVQPRFLETVSMWGLAAEIHEEGPLIERTAIYKDGRKLLFNRSHQSDSRYRGLHIITQGQIERIYIRDLLRHRNIVERGCVLQDYTVEDDASSSHPVRATVCNQNTGKAEEIRAKFIVGSDGGSSMIRKQLQIPFDGVSTGIYWGIMDCIFETDYPHAWVFGSVISSKHGGCVIIPREDGYIRLYTQLDTSATGSIARSRQADDPTSESGGQIDAHSITPDEVLEQANRIFAPYKLKFAAPLSWFAIWRSNVTAFSRCEDRLTSEQYRSEWQDRIRRQIREYILWATQRKNFTLPPISTSYEGADSELSFSHVHSVMGAFGLNASILDSANLAWKIGLVAQNKAKLQTLLPTYSDERRAHAVRIIETSGRYLRFVCGSELAVPDLRNPENLDAARAQDGAAQVKTNGVTVNGHPAAEAEAEDSAEKAAEEGLRFLGEFFRENGQFLLGVDCAYGESVLSPPVEPGAVSRIPPLRVKTGVRAPNPRVCLSTGVTGYLYDKFVGPPRFHIVLFLSSLAGREVRRQASCFARGFSQTFHKYGGPERFNVVVVLKRLPFELDGLREQTPEMESLWRLATPVYDDRAPDEDAHYTWGVNHATGGVAVIRPDLWVGLSVSPCETERIGSYFDAFLLAAE